MKNLYLLFCFALIVQITYSQIVNIPDANFKNKLLQDSTINTNGDNEIQVSEAEATLYMDVNSLSSPKIHSLEGIQYFINLIRLSCHKNQLSDLDLSQNTKLEYLQCGDNFLTYLDVSHNPNLLGLFCPTNFLTGLNMKNGNTNSINTFVATHNPNLVCIMVDDVDYANSLPNCPGGGSGTWCIDEASEYSEDCSLFNINIPDANFKNALVNTNCVDTNGDGQGDAVADTNNDGEIQQGEAEAIVSLHISNNNINSIEGIYSFTKLEYLDCSLNQLSELNFSFTSTLKYLWCGSNQLTNLDVSLIPNLIALGCSSNLLSSIMLDQNSSLKFLQCQHNLLTRLDIANGNNTILERMWTFNNPDLTCIRVEDIEMANNQVCDQANNTGWCKDANSDYCLVNIDIPDANF